MGELERTVAIVFKRKGKSMLSEKEFLNTLLFDLRWSDPGKSPKIDARDAQRILDAAVRTGLLTNIEGVLKPAFHYKDIDIPLNYLPSKNMLVELGQSVDGSATGKKEPVSEAPLPADVPLFSVLIEDIATQTHMKKKDVVARINKLQEKLTVVPEVAGLIVARELGLDISKYYEMTEEEIKRK